MTNSASRTQSFLQNSFWSMVLMLVNLFSGFIVPRAIIGAYGSEVNGLVNSLTQMVSYISLVEAGIGASAVFALYGPLAIGDQCNVDAIVTEAKRFYYRSGLIFTMLIFALAIIYPLLVKTETIKPAEIMVLVVSLGATGFLDFFTLAKYQVLFTAGQCNWVVQIATSVYRIFYTIAVIVMSSLNVPVATVYLLAIAAIFIRAIVLVSYTKKIYPHVNFSSKNTYSLKQHWDAFYLQILGAVQSGAPLLVATFLLQDLKLVSIYSIYLLVGNGVQNVIASFCNGTQASFGDVIARGQKSVLKKTFAEFQTALYFVAGVGCGTAAALVVPFVRLYTKGVADVDYVRPVLGTLVMLNVFLYHLKSPQGLLVIAAGHYRKTRLQTTAQAVILLVGTIVLGVLFGLEGIVLGCCLSNFYRDIDLLFYVPHEITGTSPMETVCKMLLSCIVAATIYSPYKLLSPPCSAWSSWLIQLGLLILWGSAVSLAVLRLTQRVEFSALLARLKNLKR
ncbi:hypothetical protein Corgl_1189 [Coriobacterium glomerans PW2]|uniref:Polysaccharide transport protein n=2 Tax=Coriobacterium TaxID=33870 RepID=F2N8B0_CORGP|nr:hypothetical protein Corgl_1189 [Coriobacterium glomerans PW2]